jgi:fermentation-respiration switch protein FrsA (DUF1100 family)
MRRVTTLLLLLLGGYLVVCAVAFLYQDRLVYFPERDIAATPREVGLEYRDIELRTEDGLRLHGWFVPSVGSGRALLFFHGNGGNISHRLDSIRIFHELGMSVLIFDYRGYGASEGSPGERGIYLDAEAAWHHLVDVEGYPPRDIVLFGRSLGGAVAVEVATRHEPRALILESTFTTLTEVGARAYPWLPVRWLSRNRYDARSRIGRVTCPKLFIHSRDDELVPFALGRRLFELAPEPKEFLEIHGHHNDGFLVSETRYRQALQHFLSRVWD